MREYTERKPKDPLKSNMNVQCRYIVHTKERKKKIEVKTKINKMLNSKNEKFAVQFSTVKHECVVPYTLYINGTALPR